MEALSHCEQIAGLDLFVKCFIFWMIAYEQAQGRAWRRRQGHPGVSQGNILSVTLSPFHLPFRDRAYSGYLVIQPFPLDLALINTSYQTCTEAFLMTTSTTSFFLILLSHSAGQTKTSTSPCIQRVIYEVLTF